MNSILTTKSNVRDCCIVIIVTIIIITIVTIVNMIVEKPK